MPIEAAFFSSPPFLALRGPQGPGSACLGRSILFFRLDYYKCLSETPEGNCTKKLSTSVDKSPYLSSGLIDSQRFCRFFFLFLFFLFCGDLAKKKLLAGQRKN